MKKILNRTNFSFPKKRPERVLQFGTSILLRGLPDYFIHKGNELEVFDGAIVVVKSTAGSVEEFSTQDHLFTTCIRGIENASPYQANIINSAIARTLQAQEDWASITEIAQSPDLQIIISNTTEVGIQYVEESIFQKPPHSFPAKLTALLWARQQYFKVQGSDAPKLVIIPTELISENGKKLKEIVIQQAYANALETDFLNWLESHVVFCNSLVDRIVTQLTDAVKDQLDYEDQLAIQTEPYRLWAIEGNQQVKDILTFAQADTEGLIITPDINYYKERKIRLLNGTHTLSVCLGYLSGLSTVLDCMQAQNMSVFIRQLLLKEIVPSLTAELGQDKTEDLEKFAHQVLDRFSNPFTAHYLLNITLQSTAKMLMRNVPTLLRYQQTFEKVPSYFALGFAAYLVFMKIVKEENGKFYAKRADDFYEVKDDSAAYFYELWQTTPQAQVVHQVLSNKTLWQHNLSAIDGFEEEVSQYFDSILAKGASQMLADFLSKG